METVEIRRLKKISGKTETGTISTKLNYHSKLGK